MDKGKIFSVSSILSKKEISAPMKPQLSSKYLQKSHKDRLKKNRKVHLEKLRLEISEHLLKQYVKDMNYQSLQKANSKDMSSIDKVQSYWQQKISSSPKNKQKCEREGLQILNRKLFPNVRENKNISGKKAKTKFLNESLEALHESEIISGAKKMIDSREVKKRRYGESEDIGQYKHKVKINGSRIYEGKIGPWKFQEEAMLDFYT